MYPGSLDPAHINSLEADTLAAHLTAPSKKKKTPAGGIYDAIAKRYLKKLSFVILLVGPKSDGGKEERSQSHRTPMIATS